VFLRFTHFGPVDGHAAHEDDPFLEGVDALLGHGVSGLQVDCLPQEAIHIGNQALCFGQCESFRHGKMRR
jgi:hypothetical protein